MMDVAGPVPSVKPYQLRALYEWCSDNGFTPYLAVAVDHRCRVPLEHVKDGQIVFNIGMQAVSRLQLDNDLVTFMARFSGVSRAVSVPVANVAALYARENGHGMGFEPELADDEGAGVEAPSEVDQGEDEPPPDRPSGRPRLQRIK